MPGDSIARGEGEVMIEDDLRDYLHRRYDSEGITENEIRSVVLQLRSLSASALYESNKKFCSWLSDGFMLKHENPKDKDILVELLDFRSLGERSKSGFCVDADEEAMPLAADVAAKYHADCNIVKIVNPFEIVGSEKRIPDGILFVNGLPLVVFEFKSAVRDESTVFNAYEQ